MVDVIFFSFSSNCQFNGFIYLCLDLDTRKDLMEDRQLPMQHISLFHVTDFFLRERQ